MGSNNKPSPAARKFAEVTMQSSGAMAKEVTPAKSPYTIDEKGNITVTGSITSDQLKVAQEEAKGIRTQAQEAGKNKAVYGNESVADVQAREAQTIKNPRKTQRRAGGRSSLVNSPLGGSSSTSGALG